MHGLAWVATYRILHVYGPKCVVTQTTLVAGDIPSFYILLALRLAASTVVQTHVHVETKLVYTGDGHARIDVPSGILPFLES